jgi:tetratricopeptide (TPR) repeat protein
VWTAARGWQFAEALEYTRRAVALQPSLVDAHNSLGSLYFHYGFLDDARRELELSLSLDPRDGCDDLARCQGFSRPRVARVYWYRQQFDSALAVYEGMPYIGGFAWERAVVLTALGRPREALTFLDQSTWRGAAESSDWEAARGLAHAALGDTVKALEHLEAAAARPRDTRGWAAREKRSNGCGRPRTTECPTIPCSATTPTCRCCRAIPITRRS